MTENNFFSLFQREIPFELTADQEAFLASLATFLDEPASRSVFIVKGFAGTGKTSMLSALVRVLARMRLRTLLMAPTGRAAKVFSGYSGASAYTIHKVIYRQKSAHQVPGRFGLDRNLYSDTLFIVDEASMIANSTSDGALFGSGRLLDDLLEYVASGRRCKLILSGDTAQLPPVGSALSPALDGDEFRSLGYRVTEVQLRQVVRQNAQSRILSNATLLRNLMETDPVPFPQFATAFNSDVVRLAGGDFAESLADAYSHYGEEEVMVVCRTNKRANLFNEGIRGRILYREEEICAGDRVMIVKNNYSWIPENESLNFLANGDIATLRRIGKYEERYGYRFLNVDLELPDYGNYELSCKVLLNTLSMESPSLSSAQSKEFFYAVAEDYAHLQGPDRWKAVRADPFYSAVQIKFAYAVTCHKAQGGQWKAVYVDQGWFADDMLNLEYLRWLYTAVTRPVEQLYLVNFDPRFLQLETEE